VTVVDAFLYAGERDMCELRLRTLAEAVDMFVPVICARTHQGEPVDLAGLLDLPDVARTVDVRPYVTNPEPIPDGTRGGVGSRWYQFIERQHRDAIVRGCDAAGVPGDAVVMVSDVDEIPSPDTVVEFARRIGASDRVAWYVAAQRFHSTALDLLHPQQPWLGTTASRATDLAPQQMRDCRGQLYDTDGATVRDGGWHFSWFGTDDERARKLDTFSHAELRDVFDPAVARTHFVHANGEKLTHLTVAQVAALGWPAPIVDGTFAVPDHWWICPPQDPGR
jgi:hypothetical protein